MIVYIYNIQLQTLWFQVSLIPARVAVGRLEIAK